MERASKQAVILFLLSIQFLGCHATAEQKDTLFSSLLLPDQTDTMHQQKKATERHLEALQNQSPKKKVQNKAAKAARRLTD